MASRPTVRWNDGKQRWMAWVRFPDGSRRKVERVEKADAENDLNELLALRAANEHAPARRERQASFAEVIDAWLDAGCPTSAPPSLITQALRPIAGVVSVRRSDTLEPRAANSCAGGGLGRSPRTRCLLKAQFAAAAATAFPNPALWGRRRAVATPRPVGVSRCPKGKQPDESNAQPFRGTRRPGPIVRRVSEVATTTERIALIKVACLPSRAISASAQPAGGVVSARPLGRWSLLMNPTGSVPGIRGDEPSDRNRPHQYEGKPLPAAGSASSESDG